MTFAVARSRRIGWPTLCVEFLEEAAERPLGDTVARVSRPPVQSCNDDRVMTRLPRRGGGLLGYSQIGSGSSRLSVRLERAEREDCPKPVDHSISRRGLLRTRSCPIEGSLCIPNSISSDPVPIRHDRFHRRARDYIATH